MSKTYKDQVKGFKTTSSKREVMSKKVRQEEFIDADMEDDDETGRCEYAVEVMNRLTNKTR